MGKYGKENLSKEAESELPKYQQLKVKGNLRVCGKCEFRIHLLLQMRSQDTNLKRSYDEKRCQQKFKTKLNKL